MPDASTAGEAAELRFAEFQARQENEPGVAFDAWLEDQPADLHPPLREMHRDLLAFPRIDHGALFSRGSAGSIPSPGSAHGVGSRIGDFQLLRFLGRGGMGQVWEARQISLRRRVALKLLAPGAELDERAQQRFAREAEAGARLQHSGIVAVHAYGVTDGEAYIAQELVGEGCTLRDFIDDARKAFEEPAGFYRKVARLFVQVAEALQAAHDAGVIHRDVKPQNILITPDDQPKVADFGLARLADAAGISRTGDFIGSYAYMSPEQAMARRIGIDARTDVFSLGVTLYEVLTLSRPFEGDTSQQVLEKILYADPPDPRTIRSRTPRELALISLKAMEKRRERRYPSMRAFAEDLQRYLEGRPIAARAPGAARRAGRWAKRNRRAVLAGLLVPVLTAAGLLVDRTLDDRARAAKLEELSRLEHWQRRFRDLRTHDPASLPEMRALVSEAESLIARRPEHERRLADLRATARSRSDGEAERDRRTHERFDQWRLEAARRERAEPTRDARAIEAGYQAQADPIAAGGLPAPELVELEAQLARRRTWCFDHGARQWEHDALAAHLAGLDALTAENGPLERVRRAIRFASLVRRRTLLDEAAARWERAIASITDPTVCPSYGGLSIEPQLGLLPLDRNPETGLWEFLHVQSGERPRRGADGASWELDAASGMVLVLLPGGRFQMGVSEGEADASDDERPAHAVDLDPFFVSRYEMTQAQYRRWMGRDASAYTPEHRYVDDLTHPLEQVSWYDAMEVTRQLGLALPTEAQWEYAARAGTATPWWTGVDRESLRGIANVADGSALEDPECDWLEAEKWPEYRDGYVVHGPVDSMRANPFGLHHVHGNVAEWCLDRFGGYGEHPVLDPRTGERLIPPPAWRVHRGGSCKSTAREVRSSYRNLAQPEFREYSIGVRPVRQLEGGWRWGER